MNPSQSDFETRFFYRLAGEEPCGPWRRSEIVLHYAGGKITDAHRIFPEGKTEAEETVGNCSWITGRKNSGGGAAWVSPAAAPKQTKADTIAGVRAGSAYAGTRSLVEALCWISVLGLGIGAAVAASKGAGVAVLPMVGGVVGAILSRSLTLAVLDIADVQVATLHELRHPTRD